MRTCIDCGRGEIRYGVGEQAPVYKTVSYVPEEEPGRTPGAWIADNFKIARVVLDKTDLKRETVRGVHGGRTASEGVGGGFGR